MNDRDAAKAERERQVFAEFCGAAGLSLDLNTVTSQKVPNPDIRCIISGNVHFAEMVEITDERVARSVNTSGPGTVFSQEEPLRKAFESKALNRYATEGAALHLVAYYDKQYPFASDKTLIPETVGKLAEQMVSSGNWQHIWVYDTWKKRILWQYPKTG